MCTLKGTPGSDEFPVGLGGQKGHEGTEKKSYCQVRVVIYILFVKLWVQRSNLVFNCLIHGQYLVIWTCTIVLATKRALHFETKVEETKFQKKNTPI